MLKRFKKEDIKSSYFNTLVNELSIVFSTKKYNGLADCMIVNLN